MKVRRFSHFLLVACLAASTPSFAGGLGVGLGLTVGAARLEGDIKNPKLSPIVTGSLKLIPTPYFMISGDLGYSLLSMDGHPVHNDLQTTLVPFELGGVINFLPFGTVNPFVMVGGGGTFWQARKNGQTIVEAGRKQEGIDSFLKAGAGVEFRVSPRIGLSIGATYRYSLTDALDQLWQGDEKDQVLDVYGGFTYYFGRGEPDKDKDGIPDSRDLMPDIAEDADGYMDHDGIPEKNPSAIADRTGIVTNNSTPNPVVIHSLVTRAEAGKNIPIKATVYSNAKLKVVATIYRPVGTRNWQVVKLRRTDGNLFEGEIPGHAVTTDGVEYCVIAVDETVKGIGYSGLPSKPVRVAVYPNGTAWRVAGGVVGAAAIGTATYLVSRKQKK